MRFKKIIPSVGALAMLMAGATAAHAQDTTGAAAASTDSADEIVVTGTSIRGVAPVGAQVIGLDAQDIKTTSAISSAQVLAHIPQLSDFGSTPSVNGSNNFQLAINRPTLRNLGSGVASTSATLFLMDGHRLPGSGVLQTFVDPDVIPASLLQRVEVVPDGGSSIYGSDAVAGVVNFITRNDFEGVQADYRHGFGDGFDTNDAALTMGTKWSTGSLFGAVTYSQRDPLMGSERDYVRDLNWATGNASDFRCAIPNVTVGGVTTSADGGPENFCDPAREQSLFSSDQRTSILAGFNQTLSDSLNFNLKAWYTTREVDADAGPARAEAIVGGQQVDFSFAPVRDETSSNNLETWGFSPSIRWDLGHEWEMRAYLDYGMSTTRTRIAAPLVTGRVQAAVDAGIFDPFNVADPATLDAVNGFLDNKIWPGFGRDEITQVNDTVDGPLFNLPGGAVRAAVGVEHYSENFQTFSDGTSNFTQGDPFTTNKASRDVSAAFVEFNIPIVGENNRLPLIYSLALDLSARHDDYSDDQIGGVNTKRYGFTYEPTDWIKVAGHWGDSFQAPGLADIARTSQAYTAIPFIPVQLLVAPEDRAIVNNNPQGLAGYNFFAVQGTQPGLKPQDAEAWDLSIDVTPPILNNNLTFGATFWNIDYAGRIGSALTFIGNPSVFALFPGKLQHSTTGLSYDDAEAAFPGATAILEGLRTNGKPLYAIDDFQNTNTGGDRREGLDVRASYTQDVGFGTVFGNLNATHMIHYQLSTDEGAPFLADAVGLDTGAPDWKYTMTGGVTVGDHWLAQLTWNHTDGQDIASPLGAGTPTTVDDQSSYDAYNTFDLYAQYDFDASEGWGQDLTLSLGVTNFTNEDPPLLKSTPGGGAAGFVLADLNYGRLIQVGISKHF